MRLKVNLSPFLSSLILLAVLQSLTSSVQGEFAISFFVTCLKTLWTLEQRHAWASLFDLQVGWHIKFFVAKANV